MERPKHPRFQHTLAREVHCTGIGLHSGAPVNLSLQPAEEGTGIVFIRTDLGQEALPARYDLVTETRLGTTIANEDNTIRVATIEHLMSALAGQGVDNARVLLNGPEVPIVDGSAAPFVALIEQAGLRAQSALRRYLEITSPFRLDTADGWIAFAPHDGFQLEVSIDFDHHAIRRQTAKFNLKNGQFARQLAGARTFGFAHEVAWMQANGLARGGSLENAIVLGDTGVMNAEGLRYPDEFARHKALDLIGDFALAGMPILGSIRAFRPGHALNNQALRALFAARSCWRISRTKTAETLTPAYNTRPALAAAAAGMA